MIKVSSQDGTDGRAKAFELIESVRRALMYSSPDSLIEVNYAKGPEVSIMTVTVTHPRPAPPTPPPVVTPPEEEVEQGPPETELEQAFVEAGKPPAKRKK